MRPPWASMIWRAVGRPRPVPPLLVRVEGVEHLHRGPLVHAAAGVDQVEGDAVPRDARAGDELAAVGHRFQGVLHQVDERRLQRLGVEQDARQVGIEIADDLDA